MILLSATVQGAACTGDGSGTANTASLLPAARGSDPPEASSATSSSAPPVENGEPTIGDIAPYSLVFSLGYDQPSLDIIAAAADKVFGRCMNEAGFEGARLPRARNIEATAAREYKMLLFSDIEEIEANGYHWFLPFNDASSPEATEPSVAQLHTDMNETCVKAVNAALNEGKAFASAADVIVAAQADLNNRQRSAVELDDARLAWSTCMENEGYGGLQLTDATWIVEFLQADRPSDEEVRTALADARCRQATGYTQKRMEWLSQEVAAWIATNAGTVAAVREAMEAEVSRAKVILSG